MKSKGMKFMNKGMLKTGCQLAFAMAMLVELSGCATSANPAAMALTAPAPAAKAFPAPLQHAMCVRNVSGGEETNPLWVSKVDDKGFRQALSASLDSAGLSSPTPNCVFPIDANLLGLSQPGMGFDMEVTSHVNYKVYDASGQPVVLATIDAPYTAKMGNSLLGVERLRLANEGAIRTSISMFFDKLRDSTPK